MSSELTNNPNVGSEIKFNFNYKCARFNCTHRFYLSPDDNLIRCPKCGYRILHKLRTRNYITHKTE